VDSVVAAAEDGIVRGWERRTGRCRSSLKGHEGKLHCVEVVRNQPRAVSGSADGTLRLWDLTSERCLYVMDTMDIGERGDDGWVGHFSLDGPHKVLSGHKTGVVVLWDVRQKREAALLEGHTDHVQHTQIHGPPTHTFVTCSRDKTIRIWDYRRMQCRSVLQGHESLVVKFVSDPAKIFSASWDGTVRLWKHATGERLDTISVHGGEVRALALDEAGMLMTGDSNGELWCHDYSFLG